MRGLFWMFLCVSALWAQNLLAPTDSLFFAVMEQEGAVYEKKEKQVFHKQVKELIAFYRERIRESTEDAEAHYRLARLHMVLNTVGDRQRAKWALEEAVRLAPQQVDYQLTLGKLLLSQMFWYNGNAYYEKVVHAFPNDRQATAQAHYWMGYYALQEFLAYKDRLIMGHEGFAETDRLKAILSFKQSIEADPTFTDAYYHLGLVYLESQQPDSLVHYARQVLQQDPDNAHALLFCGLGYQSLGDEEEAYAFYTSALDGLPDDERKVMASVEYLTLDADSVFVDGAHFWKQKDPLLLTPFNESQMDHYRRVAYANLRFSRLFRHVAGWQTDRGKTYIRFGPYVSRSVYESRETWHYGTFRIHFRRGADLDAWYFDGEELEEARLSLKAGYWPDHGRAHFKKQAPIFHDPYRGQKYDMPHQVSAFVHGDRMRLEVAYAIPVSTVDVSQAAHVQTGLFLFDAKWDSVAGKVDKAYVFDFETHQTPEGLFWVVDSQFELAVEPVHMRGEAGNFKTGRIGTFRIQKEGITRGLGLAMSDMMLASRIEMLRPDPQGRADLEIVQNPLRTFQKSKFLHVYFEVYGLQRDAFGRVRYEVSYRVGWPKEEQIDASLFMALDKPEGKVFVEEEDLAPEGVRDYRVRYVLPEQPRLVYERDGNDTETEVTVHYEGDRVNEVVFLAVDLKEVPVGVHVLQVRVSQGDVDVVREVFFRVVD